MSLDSADLQDVVADKELVVCAGSGGVGKTTTSAVLALHAAIEGRKTLVLTIDPAKRLANSLGVGSLSNEIQQIPISQFESIGVEPTGEMHAMMLDMKESFDHVVRKYAPDEETKDNILSSRLYHFFSTSLAGTQEYAAAEKLYELHEEEDFDLIVLDTPPTTHALDFLEAPNRLANAIDNKALQWLYEPSVFGQSGMGFISIGTSYVMKTLSRFTGVELLRELSDFLEEFSSMFEGFSRRGKEVRELLMSELASFVVVTSPDPLTIKEAIHFHDKLDDERVDVGAFVVNQVHPKWFENTDFESAGKTLEKSLRAWLETNSEPEDNLQPSTFAKHLVRNGKEFKVLARKDRRSIQNLRDAIIEEIDIATIPLFSEDIHSLSGLNAIRKALFKAASVS